MDMMILVVITVFFALVGLVDFCVGTGRWLRRSGQLTGAVLVVEVTQDDEAAEARLLQAADVVMLTPELRGISMAVVCPRDCENEIICQSFCRDKGIPVAEQWEKLDEIIHR